MTDVDADYGAADDLIVRDSEQVRQLYAACQEGIARLGTLGASESTTANGATAAHWQSRLCLNYERRALRLQERPAYGSRGLIAKCGQLELLLDYKAASIDNNLRRAVMLFLADTRRVAM